MTNDFLEFQEVMFRTYVRNVIFFATLPYYLTQQLHRNHGWDGDGARASDPSSIVFLDQYRNDRSEKQSMSCR
jgi:hypothetical protein